MDAPKFPSLRPAGFPASLAVLALACISPCLAQVPDTLWARRDGHLVQRDKEGRSFALDSEGNFLFVGAERPAPAGGGRYGMFLLKMTLDGRKVWEKEFSLAGMNVPPEIIRSSRGGYLIAGYTSTETDGVAYLMKVDDNGDSLWRKELPQGRPRSLVENPDGTVLIAGSLSPAIVHYLGLIKTDADGDTVWTRRDTTLGQAHHVIPDGQGGYYLAGRTGISAFLARIDGEGNRLWLKQFSDPTSSDHNKVRRIGGRRLFFLSGGFSVTDAYLLDTLGNRIYHRQLGKGFGMAQSEAKDVWIENENSFVMYGGLFGQMNCLDTNGLIKWMGNSGAGSMGHRVEQLPDRSFLVAGDLGPSSFGFAMARVAFNWPPYFIPDDNGFPAEISEDSLFQGKASARDSFPGDAVSYRLAAGPSRLAVDSITGVITWTPQHTDTGLAGIRIAAIDRKGQSDTLEATIRVRPVNDPPRISRIVLPVRNFLPGDTVRFRVEASDEEADPLVFSWLLNGKDTLAGEVSGSYVIAGGNHRYDTLLAVVSDGRKATTASALVRIGEPPSGTCCVPGSGDGLRLTLGSPAGHVTLNLSAPGGGRLELLNVRGQCLWRTRVPVRGGDLHIPVSSSPGIYLLSYSSRSGSWRRVVAYPGR